MGIDLGIQARSVAVVLDERGEVLVDGLGFELSVEELERVERAALENAESGTKLHVVIEKTFPTCEYVSGFFSARGHEVSFAKPDQVKEARKFLSPKVKTDRRDAWVMARLPYLDPRQLERVHVPTPDLRELKVLVSQRVSMIRQLTLLKNQLIRAANAIWPGISRVFDSLDSKHARAFLEELEPEVAVRLGEDGIADLLRKKGQNKVELTRRLAARLMPVAKRAACLLGLVDKNRWLALHRGHVSELIKLLKNLEELLRAKEQQILECYRRADPEELVTSIVGIGEGTAPTILSYFGEPERFPTSSKAQGFVGLYPETDASGTSDRKGTALSKRGPAQLRRDLFLVADSFRRHDPQGARLYYEQMANKGRHHHSALCVVANRLVIPRILAVLKEKRPYEIRDFDGNAITKEQARELVASFQVPEVVRERVRNKKRPPSKASLEQRVEMQKSRSSQSPQMTSELEAPRNGRALRPEDPSKLRVNVTKEQLAQLVYREMDRLLNCGGNLEEIRLAVRVEAARFFEERA
jgi:transposase